MMNAGGGGRRRRRDGARKTRTPHGNVGNDPLRFSFDIDVVREVLQNDFTARSAVIVVGRVNRRAENIKELWPLRRRRGLRARIQSHRLPFPQSHVYVRKFR